MLTWAHLKGLKKKKGTSRGIRRGTNIDEQEQNDSEAPNPDFTAYPFLETMGKVLPQHSIAVIVGLTDDKNESVERFFIV